MKKSCIFALGFDTYKGQKLQPRCNRDVTEQVLKNESNGEKQTQE
jgi:hypothetical protein